MTTAGTEPTAAPTPAPPALTKAQTFVRRLGSTVVLWTIVLTAIFSTNILVANHVFLALMMLLAWTGMLEFYGLVEKRGQLVKLPPVPCRQIGQVKRRQLLRQIHATFSFPTDVRRA